MSSGKKIDRVSSHSVSEQVLLVYFHSALKSIIQYLVFFNEIVFHSPSLVNDN